MWLGFGNNYCLYYWEILCSSLDGLAGGAVGGSEGGGDVGSIVIRDRETLKPGQSGGILG